MADKFVNKSHEAILCGVRRYGTSGIIIQFGYEIEGRKHNTCVTHDIRIDLCEMTSLGRHMHRIMDELSNEWHQAKNIISGKG